MSDHPRRLQLPASPLPYVLGQGEGPAFLVAGQAVRMLATEAETAGAFGVVLCVSGQDPGPIPMHWHAREHDTWLCTRGRVQVWHGDQSRVLAPGDFAYVKPGDAHSYRCMGASNAFLGVVAPGGWEKFFEESGMPWPHAVFPETGEFPPDFARMGPAMGKFGVNRIENPRYAEAAAGPGETALPGAARSYVLEAGYGARRVVGGVPGGVLVTTLAGEAETGGVFAMHSLEASAGRTLVLPAFADAHQMLHVLEGALQVTLEGVGYAAACGASVNIPAGHGAVLRVVSGTARWISVASGAALARHFARLGHETAAFAPPWHGEG